MKTRHIFRDRRLKETSLLILESLKQSLDPISDEQTIFEDKAVNLWGTGPERLVAGKHQFPCTFQLPANLPSSHYDLCGEIEYTLTATIPTRKRDITVRKKIYVLGVVVFDTPELMRPVSDSGEKTIAGGCCCFAAPFVVSGKIDKGGYAQGRTEGGFRKPP